MINACSINFWYNLLIAVKVRKNGRLSCKKAVIERVREENNISKDIE